MEISPDLITKLLHYLPGSILFCALLLLIGRFFFRRIPKEAWQPPEETAHFSHGKLTAIGIYLLLTIVYFAPYLSRLGTMLIGPPEDNMQSYWNLWYGWEVFRGHYDSLFQCNIIAYPEGTSLLYHSLSYYNLGLSLLLRQIGGLTLAYNLLVMHTFVLAGLGAFLLGRYLLRDDYLALLVGLIFAFNPFHYVQALHHYNIVSLQFVPFFVLFYIRAVREHKIKYTLLAALFLILNALCSWIYLILGFYFIVLSYGYLALRRRSIFLWDVIGRTAVVVGLTGVALSYLLVPMVIAALEHRSVYQEGHDVYVADLAGFILPTASQWLGHAKPIRALTELFTGNQWESAVYLGLSLIVIVLATIRRSIAESSRYLLMALASLVLSMGEMLHVLGWRAPIFLPYRVLSQLPFLSNMRVPARHVVYAFLFLAIVAAIGLQHLCRSHGWNLRAKLCLLALSALIVMDFYPFYNAQMTPLTLPPAYTAIKQHGEGVIFDLPNSVLNDSNYPLFYQTMHGMPMVACKISRKLEPTLGDSLGKEDVDTQLKQLVDDQIRYIVIHKRFLDAESSLDTLAYDTRCRRLYADSTEIVYLAF